MGLVGFLFCNWMVDYGVWYFILVSCNLLVECIEVEKLVYKGVKL